MKLEDKFFKSFFYPFILCTILSTLVVTLFLLFFTNNNYNKRALDRIINIEKKYSKININSVSVLLTTTIQKIQAGPFPPHRGHPFAEHHRQYGGRRRGRPSGDGSFRIAVVRPCFGHHHHPDPDFLGNHPQDHRDHAVETSDGLYHHDAERPDCHHVPHRDHH